MRAALILLALLASLPEAVAKPKRSGASQMESFATCVETSVLGDAEGECRGRGESENCIGVRRALELSEKKTKCLRLRGQDCEEWGHGEKTQSEWISVAAAHLAKFGVCIRDRYGSETSNGLEEALADEGLLTLLKKLDDGGKVFRLGDSAILIRSLHGDRFSHIIGNSPIVRELPTREVYLFKDAADTPAVLGRNPASSGEHSSNPSQEGEDFSAQFKEYAQATAAPQLPQEIRVEQRVAAPIAVKIDTPAVAMELKEKAENRLLENPYSLGLDRSLFERVSSVYRRRGGELKGTDDFIRSNLPPPAKDLGELLSRGGTL